MYGKKEINLKCRVKYLHFQVSLSIIILRVRFCFHFFNIFITGALPKLGEVNSISPYSPRRGPRFFSGGGSNFFTKFKNILQLIFLINRYSCILIFSLQIWGGSGPPPPPTQSTSRSAHACPIYYLKKLYIFVKWRTPFGNILGFAWIIFVKISIFFKVINTNIKNVDCKKLKVIIEL